MDVYDRITMVLKQKDKTRRDLCNDTGLSYDTLSGLFKRKSDSIKLDTLKLIANYLNVSIDWLIEGGSEDYREGDALAEKIFSLVKKLSVYNKAKVLLFISDLKEGND